jgi:hypothetical protein
MKCGQCGKKTDGLNPPIILKPLTNLGYQEMDFCSIVCFVGYVKKKFKLRGEK